MNTLYEIDREILNCIDDETGEVNNFEKLEQLQTDKRKKIENIALYIKNLSVLISGLCDEITALLERKKQAENKVKALKKLLDKALDGSKFENAKVKISYRKSKVCDIEDGFMEWAQSTNHDELLSYQGPIPNKKAIKDAILSGENIPYAAVVEKNNICIK